MKSQNGDWSRYHVSTNIASSGIVSNSLFSIFLPLLRIKCISPINGCGSMSNVLLKSVCNHENNHVYPMRCVQTILVCTARFLPWYPSINRQSLPCCLSKCLPRSFWSFIPHSFLIKANIHASLKRPMMSSLEAPVQNFTRTSFNADKSVEASVVIAFFSIS